MGKLNDTMLKAIKPQDKAKKYSDGQGLYLYVAPSGAKSWRLDYSYEGKRKTYTLGLYPTVTLMKARRALLDFKVKLSENIDPASEKKAVKEAIYTAEHNTFESIAREWHIHNKEKWIEKHFKTIIQRLEKNIFPYLGKKEISTITSLDLLSVLRKIEERGAIETAHRVKNICGQVFRYAIATGRVANDPTAGLQGALKPVKVEHFATVTDKKEIANLLNAIDNYHGKNLIVKYCLRIMPYVFLRSNELRLLRWENIDFEAKEIHIPAERMKMKQKHIVPMSKQVLALFEELKEFTGHTNLVFVSTISKEKTITGETLLTALRRMGFDQDEMTIHGFRAIATTLLNEQGYNRDWIERQLAHSERNSVRASYNYAEYLPERRRMMQEWADFLDDLKAKGK